MNNKFRSTFVVLGTGGTISGRSARDSDNVAYAVGEVGVDALVRDLPGGSPDNGMVLLNVSEYWRYVVSGAVILVAVLLNQLLERVR